MSRISRIVSGVVVTLVLLGAVETLAEANAIYTVDQTVPDPVFGHVTGELVTDGTLGPLEFANVVDWNLTVESLLGTDTLLGPLSGGNSFFLVTGDALTAMPDGLYFDFGVIGLLWATNGGFPHLGSFWCLEHAVGICNIDSGETIGSKSVEGFRPRTGNVQIATLKSRDVDVPEPTSVALLAAGALAVLRRRVRRPVGSTRPGPG